MVQGSWAHINRGYSLLTRIEAILLDGHFLIEHTARNRSGCFFNFNGTAGIWRREAIDDAGGWAHDTLTEDLDLSYRAQLAGWRFLYLPELAVPSELPVDINGFKNQQYRWAKGSIQTGRKLLARMLATPAALAGQVRGLRPPDQQLELRADGAAVAARSSRPWCCAGRHLGPMLLLVDLPLFLSATVSVLRLLHGEPGRARAGLAAGAALPAGAHGGGDRPLGQQRPGGPLRASASAAAVPPHAQVPDREAGGGLARQALPRRGPPRVPGRGARSRSTSPVCCGLCLPAAGCGCRSPSSTSSSRATPTCSCCRCCRP